MARVAMGWPGAVLAFADFSVFAAFVLPVSWERTSAKALARRDVSVARDRFG